MADLGKAYVQIMPSAQGISGSIQKTLNPESIAAGRSAGNNIASSMSESLSSLGSTFTKRITLPALGAMTAVTGLVTALGFKRLIGMDNARAKLEGMGYEGERLEKVMNDAREAVTGTTMTMAEGVDIASGALAAGVDQGADLEHYIKLVGSAAVGANRPVGDMAQIFNRVQGAGKLMTMELNMIEQGMPGFAQAMADNVADGSMESFRSMVTNGEVGSKEFLDVMDNFAGGMADAYADTWSGMAKNVLSNIGIIGEALIGGLFEDGKAGLANFLEVLRSDGLKEWAASTGEKIRELVGDVVEFAKKAIKWWVNLDDGTKQLFKTLATIAVVIGPMLTVLAKVALVTSKVIGVITAVVGALAKGAGGFSALKAGALAIMGPVGWITALLVALVAGGIALYMNWDTVKEKAVLLGNKIKEIWNSIKEYTVELWESVKEVFAGVMDSISNVWDGVKQYFADLWEGIKETALSVWESLKNAWAGIINWFKDVWSSISGFFVNLWNDIVSIAVNVWDTVTEKALSVVNFLMDIFSPMIDFFRNTWTIIVDTASSVIGNVVNVFKAVFDNVKNIASNAWSIIKNIILGPILLLINLVTGNMEEFKSNLSAIWGNIKESAGNIWESLKEIVMTYINALIDNAKLIFSGFVEVFTGYFTAIWETVINIFGAVADFIFEKLGLIEEIFVNVMMYLRELIFTAFEFIEGIWMSFLEFIVGGTGGAFDSIAEKVNIVMESLWDIIETIWNFIKESFLNATAFIKALVTLDFGVMKDMIGEQMLLIKNSILHIWENVKRIFKNATSALWETIKTKFSQMLESVKQRLTNIKNSITQGWENAKTAVSQKLSDMWESIKQKFTDFVDSAKSGMKNVVSSIKSGWDGAVTFFKEIDLKQIGKDIIDGLVKGIKDKVNAVKEAVTNVASAITGKIKGILGIKSPSRVFMGFGDNIVEGLAIGMDKAKGIAESASELLGSSVEDSFNPALEISGDVNGGNRSTTRAMEDMLSFDLTQKAKFNDPQSNNNNRDGFSTEQKQPIILQVDGKTFAQIIGDYTSQEGGKRIRRIERGLA